MAYILCEFKDWQLSASVVDEIRQYDDVPVELVVTGNMPLDGMWDVYMSHGDKLNIIQLTQRDTELVANAADILALSGYIRLQLRFRGTYTKHSSIASVCIPRSFSGTDQWPEIPTEFMQFEQGLLEVNQHPPVPGSNGFWLIWDPVSKEYAESEFPLPSGSLSFDIISGGNAAGI